MNFMIARTNMVTQQVRPWFVVDENVLRTLSGVPREIFVPSTYLNLAYSDTDIPLEEGQTMLPPKMVGRALQALELKGHEKVLEIGTGSGYVTACLSKLVDTVISLEMKPALLEIARKNLITLHCRNVTLLEKDGVFGFKKEAPYDAIFVTGSYPIEVPLELCEQLNIGGRLFAITGIAPTMEATLIERHKVKFTKQCLFETVVPALIHAPTPKRFQF